MLGYRNGWTNQVIINQIINTILYIVSGDLCFGVVSFIQKKVFEINGINS